MKVTRILEGNNIVDVSAKMSVLTAFHNDLGTPEDQKVRDNLMAELGFKQEAGFFVARRYPTLIVKSNGDLDVIEMVYHEPVDVLPGVTATVPVYLSRSVKEVLGSSEKEHLRIGKWLLNFMKTARFAGGKSYPHFIVGRKGKLLFSSIEGKDHPWVKHFVENGKLYRNELLAVALAARGLALSKGLEIDTPEVKVSKSADGVAAVLTASQGKAFGLFPGVWQFRSVFPFAKGTIVVWHDDSCVPFYNKDILKLNEPIPATMNGDNYIYIANSVDAYDIRLSHQAGYVLQNTCKSKQGAWGDMPELIANSIVKTVEEKNSQEQVAGYQVARVAVEELMPDYIRFLLSAGLPKDHVMTVQQITEAGEAKKDTFKAKTSGRDLIDTILLAARPVIGKMFMFVALPASAFPGMKPGWYKPGTVGKSTNSVQSGHSGLTDHVGRVPFMAVGGGIQKVKWQGVSPLNNTVICIIDEDQPDWEKSEDWITISAMGADSDGDRLFILTNQGLKMMKSAGLTIERNPEAFKAKNPYPLKEEWTPDNLMTFWAKSTPRLANVGKGDVITRDAIDVYKEDEMTWDFFYRFARYGAGEVQVGVSAPKYYFLNPNKHLAPMTAKALKDHMDENGIGQGRKFFGRLWQPARERTEEFLSDYLPDTPIPVVLPKHVTQQKWEGGYSEFHTEISMFSPELGVDWPTYVRRAFVKVLNKHGIDNVAIGKGLKGMQAKYVHKLIVAYIRAYPHRMNIWAWMMDEKFTGVPKDVVLKVIGLPTNGK